MKRQDERIRGALNGCFTAPLYSLGGSEDNCVAKLVFLTLWELGWNPVSQILFGFQVPKERIEKPAQASNEVDVVVVNGANVFLVGEAKDWYESLGPKEITQVKLYQKALDAPCAFLTNGHKWLIFDDETDEPKFSLEFTDADDMLFRLKSCLGEGNVISRPFPYSNALQKGLSIKSETKGLLRQSKPSCNYEDYGLPTVGAMVKELCRLKNSRNAVVTHGFGDSSLMLKDIRKERTIIEYRCLFRSIRTLIPILSERLFYDPFPAVSTL